MSRMEPEANVNKVELRLIRSQPGSPDSPTYPIGVASRRTGLPPATLRIWERRYRAVVPLRTEKGSRIYTEEQIERLLLLRRVLAGGWRIGQIAGLGTDELQQLAEQASANAAPDETQAPPDRHSGVAALRQDFLEAAERLDSDAMSRALEHAAVDLSRAHLFELFLSPLLEQIGDRWAEGSLRPAHEHLASSTVRRWMEGLRPSLGPSGPAAHLLLATPRGQLHELGALLAALSAEEIGWRATYLGADLPAEEIALAARELQVDAVALSAIYPAPQLASELARLRELLSPELPLFVGGAGVAAHREQLAGLNIAVSVDLKGFRDGLQRIAAEILSGS